MAHLQAEQPGAEQDVAQDVFLQRTVWFGRMTFTGAVLRGGEALSEDVFLQKGVWFGKMTLQKQC